MLHAKMIKIVQFLFTKLLKIKVASFLRHLVYTNVFFIIILHFTCFVYFIVSNMPDYLLLCCKPCCKFNT